VTTIASNTDPIYSKASDVQGSALITTAASVVYDISGTIGTDIYKIFTADATNGGFVQRIRLKYAGNSTTTSNAAVMKIWLSTVSSGTPTIGTQAWFLDEIALPATGTLTTTATNAVYDIPLNFALKAGQHLLAKITVSQPANFGWMAVVIGGAY
jgi:hypothetical protein